MSPIIGYTVGVLACVAWKWARWMQRQPAQTPWNNYWLEGLAENISSGIISLLAYGVWSSGLLLRAASLFHAALTGVTEPESLPLTGSTSMIAGFVIDYSARWVGPRIARFFGETDA